MALHLLYIEQNITALLSKVKMCCRVVALDWVNSRSVVSKCSMIVTFSKWMYLAQIIVMIYFLPDTEI